MCFRRNQNHNTANAAATHSIATQTDVVFPLKVSAGFNPFADRKQNCDSYDAERLDYGEGEQNGEWSRGRSRNGSSRDDAGSRDKRYGRGERTAFKRRRSRERSAEWGRERSRERNRDRSRDRSREHSRDRNRSSYRSDRERRSREANEKRSNAKYNRNGDDVPREPYSKRSRQETSDSWRSDRKLQERCDSDLELEDGKARRGKSARRAEANGFDSESNGPQEKGKARLKAQEAEEGEIVDSQELGEEEPRESGTIEEERENEDAGEPQQSLPETAEIAATPAAESEGPPEAATDITDPSNRSPDRNRVASGDVEGEAMEAPTENGCETNISENSLSETNNNNEHEIDDNAVKSKTENLIDGEETLSPNDSAAVLAEAETKSPNTSLSKSIRNISTNSSDYQIVEEMDDEIVVYVTRKKGHKQKAKKKKKDKKKEKKERVEKS